MPAKDLYHDTVKQALIKDGLRIVSEQVTFIIEGRQIQIDLSVARLDELYVVPIFIEVKSFLRSSPVEDLAMAVGKYMVYRSALDEAGLEAALLYLAIPQSAYDTIFSERLGVVIREKFQLSLIVVDIEYEEITEWIP